MPGSPESVYVKDVSAKILTSHVSGSPATYETTDADVRRFIREQGAIFRAYDKRRLFFQDVNIQSKFKEMLT